MSARLVLVVIALLTAAARAAPVRLDQVQVKRVHNAYHIANSVTTLSATHHDLRYTHEALQDALNHGARGLELDVEVTDDDAGADMPVFHDKNDAGTQCASLRACLRVVVGWANKHQARHMPLFMMIEVKSTALSIRRTVELIEQRIYGTLPQSRIIKASAVRGAHSSMREAVKSGSGWPTVEASRGKLLFMVQFQEEVEEDPDYNYALGNATTLFALGRDRISRNSSNTVILVPRDEDILTNSSVLASLFDQHLLLRAQVDGGLEPNAALADASIATGVHLIDTDFPVVSSLAPDDYSVRLPGGVVARCNPRTVAGCSDTGDVEAIGYIPGAEHPLGGGFWCCVPASFHYASLVIALLTLLFHMFAQCCCLRGDRRTALTTALLLLHTTAFFAPFSIRAVTDVIVLRHSVKSDDLFVAVGAFFRAVYFTIGVLGLFSDRPHPPPSLKQAVRRGLIGGGVPVTALCAVVVLLEAAGLAVSAISANKYGYGTLRSNAFSAIIALLAAASLALFGLFLRRNRNTVSTPSLSSSSWRQTVWVAVYICAPYVQLLLIAAVAAAYIGPSASILSLPERAVVWHNTLLGLECCALALSADAAMGDGAVPADAALSPSEAVALKHRENEDEEED